MYRIAKKKILNPTVAEMHIEAPLVARKAKPGQFIILRVDEDGERIPLTVAGTDADKGTVKIFFQVVGTTTVNLSKKEEGEFIRDFVGPLGVATELEGIKKVCIIGRRARLRGVWGSSYGFKSRLSHQTRKIRTKFSQ